MTISLEQVRQKFIQRVLMVDKAFERHVVTPTATYKMDRQALQEGLLSFLWQTWNSFCREVTIASAIGGSTTGGLVTTSPFASRSEAEIAYVAKRLANNETINTIKPLGRHLEPTWGDPSKINKISLGIGATNTNSLISAFGSLSFVTDLQLCRNTCAHLNGETMKSLFAARVRYGDTHLRHPSDMMFWSDPLTKDFAWKSWIDELMLVSEFAIM